MDNPILFVYTVKVKHQKMHQLKCQIHLARIKKIVWFYRKNKYKQCGSGFQPRNQMPRLEAASA